MIFFDTNIVVYAFSEDRRQQRARQLLGETGLISAQVLNEFINVARTKHRRSWRDIGHAVAVIRGQVPDILPVTAETSAAALELCARYNLPVYDALIVASALEGRCTTLMSEDFQHGMRFDGLTVENPFL